MMAILKTTWKNYKWPCCLKLIFLTKIRKDCQLLNNRKLQVCRDFIILHQTNDIIINQYPFIVGSREN